MVPPRMVTTLGTGSSTPASLRLRVAIAIALTAGCASTNDIKLGDAGSGGGSDRDTGVGAADDGDTAMTGGGSDGGTPTEASAGDDSGPGAGAVDGGDAGQAPDPCKTARFCENFESYDAGKVAGSWKIETNLGAVSVATDQHFAGRQSAKFTTQQGSNGKTAYIKLDAASVFPVPGNVYFGRMMSRLESAPAQSVHWTFIQGGGLVPGQNYHALYRYGGQQPVMMGSTFVGSQLMANYDTPDSYSGTGPSSDCWNHSKGTVVPVARWACVEWQFDGPNSTMHFWLDGAPVDALTVAGKGQGCVNQPATFPWTAPNFATLELGWESYQADDPRTLYLDDIVIATTRVGCPAVP